MNGGRERQTLRTVKVSLNPVRAAATRGIKVNANKNRVSIRVGDRDSRSQWDEHVAVSCHHNAISIVCEHGFKPLGDIQSHGFFRDALTGNSAAIESAMAGVDHHHCRRLATFRNDGGGRLGTGSGRCSRRNGLLFSRGERTGSGQTIDSRGNERPGER